MFGETTTTHTIVTTTVRGALTVLLVGVLSDFLTTFFS